MITIPWFPKELKANSRSQHRYTKDIRNKYKEDCRLLALGKKPNFEGMIPLKITFHPPCGRKRDLDNCLASIKCGLDGIAEAWGIDDSIFRPMTIDFGMPIRHGLIKVEIEL